MKGSGVANQSARLYDSPVKQHGTAMTDRVAQPAVRGPAPRLGMV